MDKSCAVVENLEIVCDLTPKECFSQIENIVHNLSSPAHTSVNYFIFRSSISEAIVSPEIVPPYLKSLPRIIMKRGKKRGKSVFLTTTAKK